MLCLHPDIMCVFEVEVTYYGFDVGCLAEGYSLGCPVPHNEDAQWPAHMTKVHYVKDFAQVTDEVIQFTCVTCNRKHVIHMDSDIGLPMSLTHHQMQCVKNGLSNLTKVKNGWD